MHLTEKDLILRFDKKNRTLQLLTIEHLAPLRLRLFYELSESAKGKNQSIENEIGIMLLSFMSTVHDSNAFDLDRYRNAAKSMDEYKDDFPSSSDQEEENAFDMAIQMIAEGLRSKSGAKMDEIEKLLRNAANAGHKKASAYIDSTLPFIKKKGLRKQTCVQRMLTS